MSAVGTEASVYVRENFSEPMTPMHNFANQYDLDNPQASMHTYNRVMHEHTKLQLERAANSARRRSQTNGTSPTGLSSESSRGSVSSSSS
ncbi:hypothetical protein HDK77DRAFT_483601 [Phyllosticta capitalensis]|uniref:Uncharacterized protein n=1 Tax=Phyllosticta capitalensis TaxID=121624 RepID=A0ABR1YG89_9PEZI